MNSAKSIEQVYSPRMRGPWNIPTQWQCLCGLRERNILAQRDTEVFPHSLNKDCDFYLNDDCTTYYSPTVGQFTINNKTKSIVG